MTAVEWVFAAGWGTGLAGLVVAVYLTPSHTDEEEER
jgi:hypothetical protein